MLTSPTMKTSEKWMMMEKRPITIVYGTVVPNKIYYTYIYIYIYIYIYVCVCVCIYIHIHIYTYTYIYIYIYIHIYTHIVTWVNLLDKIIVPPDLIKLTTDISL